MRKNSKFFCVQLLQTHFINFIGEFQADRFGALRESKFRRFVVVVVQEIGLPAEVWEGGDEARPGRGAPPEEGAESKGQRQGEKQVSKFC